MNTAEFGITQDGLVYRHIVHEWILLGHVSHVVQDSNPSGHRVRTWWQERLESDGPSEYLVVPHHGEDPYFVQSGSISDSASQLKPVDSDLAAD
jgi:hypothetical protein